MENRKKIILVPFDFTEVAEVAVNHAAGLAKHQDWSVHLLHIINKDTRALLNVYKVDDELVNKRLQDRIAEYEKKYDVSFSFEAREGSIFSDIAKAAEETKASFIIMGTHGKQGIQHIVGSYAHKVITSTNVPFIVVQKREYREGYNKIVIPLDDTIESRQKLKWAIYIAKQFDATIYIKALYRSDELYKAKLRAVLNKIVELFDKNEVKYDAEFISDSGSFAKQVIDYTKRLDADMIMIMTNQDSSPIPNFLLNPWDEQIIFNEIEVPVMTINPRDINITVVGM
ncbi:MAG: hypothetical protein C0592_12340 [Marinilabiliales bacterium]|nr:MAG: hypothetical protein C0592_12340 [Marinilabiliales bacterium]